MILLADNLSNLIATFPVWWDGSYGDRVGPGAVIGPKRRCHRLPALALVSEVRYHKYNDIPDAEIRELWIGSHKYSVAKLSLFHCSRCARIKFVRAAVVLFLPRPSNRVRKLLCNLRSSNHRRVQSTRWSKSLHISWRQSIYV